MKVPILSRHNDLDVALIRYEGRLKATISRQQHAARRIAKWFVPETESAILVRDLVARASTWPLIAPMLRRRVAAQSIFRTDSSFSIEPTPHAAEVTAASKG